MDRNRFLFATTFAPWAAPILVVIVETLIGLISSSAEAAMIGSVFLAFSYLGMLFFGVPIVWLLQRSGNLNFWSLALSGIIAGFVFLWLSEWVISGFQRPNFYPNFLYVAFGSGLGLSVAITFGILARVHRSDGRSEDA